MTVQVKFVSDTEQFFVYHDRSPVLANNVANLLKNSLKNCGMNPNNYSTQMFQAGRASDLLKLGMPVEKLND